MMQGQILANMKAMDSDWFGINMMGRKGKVSINCQCSFRKAVSINYQCSVREEKVAVNFFSFFFKPLFFVVVQPMLQRKS